MIEISETAAKKIKSLMAKQGITEGGLRVGVKGGGCSGLSYIFAWEREPRLGDDFGVLDGERLIDGLALQPFGRQARARDRRTASERLELRIVDDSGLRVHLHLQLHHVAAFRRPDEPRPDVDVVFRQRPDVTRVLVVIDDLV